MIELIISAALTALVLAGAYACLSAGISSQKLVEPRTETLQTARVILSRIGADLRCATALPKGAPFLGSRRQLGEASADVVDFATRNHTPKRPGEGDYCEMSLYVERHPQTGKLTLFRRRNPRLSFDPLSGGTREELAADIAGFRLEYYDGWEWFDSWGDPQAGSLKSEVATPKPNQIGLPEAVRITLSFESSPRPGSDEASGAIDPATPLTFQTIVRINVPQSSAPTGSASPSTTTPPNAGDPSPRPPNP
jgi:type II secretory pathway component PulJ